MNADELTYSERLRVVWFLMWRGTLIDFLIGGAIGFVIGFVMGVAGRFEQIPPLAFFGGFTGAIFIGGPLLVSMLLKKRFDGFTVRIVRPKVQIGILQDGR